MKAYNTVRLGRDASESPARSLFIHILFFVLDLLMVSNVLTQSVVRPLDAD